MVGSPSPLLPFSPSHLLTAPAPRSPSPGTGNCMRAEGPKNIPGWGIAPDPRRRVTRKGQRPDSFLNPHHNAQRIGFRISRGWHATPPEDGAGWCSSCPDTFYVPLSFRCLALLARAGRHPLCHLLPGQRRDGGLSRANRFSAGSVPDQDAGSKCDRRQGGADFMPPAAAHFPLRHLGP